MSAFDVLSENYWQQFCQDLPVGGGMDYQSRLKQCHLDLSKESLQRVDELLGEIKQELMAKNQQEAVLLQQSGFRNFLFFVAFYTIRVIACHHAPFSWQPMQEEHKHHILAQDKFYIITVAYDDAKRPLFVLMTVGARLFAKHDRVFRHPIRQELMEDSLYWLADDYLREARHLATNHGQTTKGNKPQADDLASKKDAPNHSINHPKSIHSGVSQHHLQPKSKQMVDFFAELQSDIIHLSAVNTTNQTDFDRAYHYLNDIGKIKEDALSEKQKSNRLGAIKLMVKTAQLGNTNAMLALAMYYFKGMGVKQDEQKGFAIVQKAADMNDMRAQKLLSRLYYQGYGTQSDMDLGEVWLQRAADNGHDEARKIIAQMNYGRSLQDDFRVELQKEQRYWKMMVAAVVAGIFLFWLTGKLLSL